MKRDIRVKPHKSVVCLAVGLALSFSALAEESAYFDEVVVWGTKVSSSSESIGADDMSLKQADHMSDLLRDVPGVDVGGTHSVNQRINIRGLGETDLDIRLDGASQHANMFHHIGNLTLNPDILKSAEIQVGNNSVVQGGLGGSVYFETKDAKELLRGGESVGVRVYGGYASNASHKGSITGYAQLSDKIDGMLYIHGVDNDNFEDGNGTETYGVDGEIYNILGKFGFEPSDQHRFELSYDLYRDEGEYSARPDRGQDANTTGRDADLLLPTEYDRDTVRLGYEFTSANHNADVTLYSSTTEITRDETPTSWGFLNRDSINTAKNQNVGLSAKVQSDIELGSIGNTVTYGFDYMDKNSSSTYDGVQYMDEDAISTAIFLEDRIQLIERFALTLGIRYDDYQRKAETSDTNYDEVTWAIAGEFDVTDSFQVFASTRTLFKAPELLETFIQFQQNTVLAEDLRPETGRNSQVGFKFNHWAGEHYFGSNLTVFKTQIDDYIIEGYDRSISGYYIQNGFDIELEGFELSGVYGYQGFTGKLSYAKSDADNVTDGGPYASTGSMPRSKDIGDSVSLTLDYQMDDLGLIFGWNSQFVMDEDNVLQGNPVKEGYDVHNLYVQWVPTQHDNLSVTFGIDNVFDETYTSHASTSGVGTLYDSSRNPVGTYLADDFEPGRNFKLSAAYHF